MINKMRDIEIEKIVLSCGALADKLDKSVKLLERLTGRKAVRTQTRKRIPTFSIRPGLEIGCMVTIRDNKEELLKRLLFAINNTLKEKQIANNHFSFGIPEYIEIPGIEYQRDLGALGLKVTVVFSRKGFRIQDKKIRRGKLPLKQVVLKEEIKEYLIKNFNQEIK